jgi:protein gp37
MSDHSKIEWTDATWNPLRGCIKISPGCKHCYAETFAERFRGVKGHPYEQGFDLRLVPEKLSEPFQWSGPRTVFVNSMSDLFQDDVPDAYIEDVVRVEDKKYGLPRIAHLQAAPAAVRFLSIEPLLEDLGSLDLSGIHWAIVGGESGRGARTMHPEWVENIYRVCTAQNVIFFFKQWGGVHKSKTGRKLHGRSYDDMPPRIVAPIPSRKDRLAAVKNCESTARRWQPSTLTELRTVCA